MSGGGTKFRGPNHPTNVHTVQGDLFILIDIIYKYIDSALTLVVKWARMFSSGNE